MSETPQGMLIDTDPGVDDAIALLMALASPTVEIHGLTTVGGNVSLARASRNALALLEYARRNEIPVAKGSNRPISGRYPYAHHVHGAGGLSRRLREPKSNPVAANAIDFLAEKLGQHPGQLTVVALGPLTNLARLLERHPQALGRAAQVVVMGGAVNTLGNATPYAEFNFYSDPVAAQRVISSGVPLTLVDLAACRQVAVDRETAQSLECGTPLGRLTTQLLANWFQQGHGRREFNFYDPLAVAVAIEPEIAEVQRVALEVETAEGDRLGESRITSGEGNIGVIRRVDLERFFGLMAGLLEIRGLPSAGAA